MLPKSKKLEYINSSKELLKQIKELDNKDRTKKDDNTSCDESFFKNSEEKIKLFSNSDSVLKMWDIGDRIRKFYGAFRDKKALSSSQINDLNYKKELFCEMINKIEFYKFD